MRKDYTFIKYEVLYHIFKDIGQVLNPLQTPFSDCCPPDVKCFSVWPLIVPSFVHTFFFTLYNPPFQLSIILFYFPNKPQSLRG